MKTLETKRILIRPFVDDDYPILKEMMTDPDVMRFTGFKKPQTEDKIREFLVKWKSEIHTPLGVWCAEEKESRNCIGWFMLKITGHEYPEIGFMLCKNMWGKGIALEVSRKILKYAFEELKYEKVIASFELENVMSIKVLKKLGMKESNIIGKDPKIIYLEIINQQ